MLFYRNFYNLSILTLNYKFLKIYHNFTKLNYFLNKSVSLIIIILYNYKINLKNNIKIKISNLS